MLMLSIKEYVMRISTKKMWAAAVLLLAGGQVWAEVSALVAIEPTSRKDGLSVSRVNLAASLSKAMGQPVNVVTSEDLADVMRSTRSGGYDVFIAPAQVAASALSRGYELVGVTDDAEQYVLVGKNNLASTDAVRGGRIYLPQQDSIYTYMARGMLNAAGLSFKDLKTVEHARYPQAGLAALVVGVSDATVIRRSDWDGWAKENPGVAKVLAISTAVPGGFTVVMKRDLPTEARARIAKWFAAASPGVGLKPATVLPDLAEYRHVAELGIFTPTHLPGVKVVTAAEVKALTEQGAVIVDARTDKEFKAKRVPNAVLAPYIEKSLKDVAYDGSKDDASAIARLDKSKPTIFSCNGAECWKSYKASKFAQSAGFRQVYWFRGGLPEWEASGLPVAHN